MEAALKWMVAGIIAAWVSLGTAVQFLLLFMVIDYATGMVAAAMDKQLSSGKGWTGLGKKILTLLLVWAAHLGTKALGVGYDLGAWVATAYSINELISIAENCHRSGVPIPAKLIDLLEKARSAWDGSDRRMEQKPFAGRERRARREG